jgi:hypothetical protein
MSYRQPDKSIAISASLYERMQRLARRDKTGTIIRGGIKEVAEKAILAALEAEERN